MKDITKIFNDYVKKYDFTNSKIRYKFHHSYRVMDFSIEIAKSINLSNDDIELASICGLYHDIGRFEQIKNYDTYEDSISMDHGDLGYEELKKGLISEITQDIENQNIILKATKNHNKYSIEDGLSEKELLMAKIVRDADKIDIIKECWSIPKQTYELNTKLVAAVKEHKMITNDMAKTEIDHLFREICFIFDFNFKYSYQYILDNHIIENRINLIENYTNSDLKELQDDLINYLKEMIIC